jgi:hypothetical protein
MEDEFEDYRETLKEAEKIKKALNLESINTALLILIQQDIDTIRFHNSD